MSQKSTAAGALPQTHSRELTALPGNPDGSGGGRRLKVGATSGVFRICKRGHAVGGLGDGSPPEAEALLLMND